MAEPAQQALACLGQHLPVASWMPLALEPILVPGTPQASVQSALLCLSALLTGALLHFPCCAMADVQLHAGHGAASLLCAGKGSIPDSSALLRM